MSQVIYRDMASRGFESLAGNGVRQIGVKVHAGAAGTGALSLTRTEAEFLGLEHKASGGGMACGNLVLNDAAGGESPVGEGKNRRQSE